MCSGTKATEKILDKQMGPRASLCQGKCFNVKVGYSDVRLRITVCFTFGKESNGNICEEILYDT